LTEPGDAWHAPAWVAEVRDAGRPHVLLMTGLPGAGKTVLAKRLERALPAVRLNVDEWMIPLFGEHMPRDVFDARSAVLQGFAWSIAERLVALGVHVVLDHGFWTRAARADAAARAVAAGGVPLFVVLDAPRHVLEERLARRNAAGPEGSFEITPEMLDLFEGMFEPPSPAECLPIVIHRVGGNAAG
jgi:predicted kinase